MTGLARLANKKGLVPAPDYTFSAFAAVTWGVVMWLFKNHKDTLHGGLQSSMVGVPADFRFIFTTTLMYSPT